MIIESKTELNTLNEVLLLLDKHHCRYLLDDICWKSKSDLFDEPILTSLTVAEGGVTECKYLGLRIYFINPDEPNARQKTVEKMWSRFLDN